MLDGMSDIDRLTVSATEGIRLTLTRIGALVRGVAVLAAIIGVATFATGWWVFDGSSGWLILGGLICLVPVVAAVMGWIILARTARRTAQLVQDVRSLLQTGRSAATVLIDHDSGQSIAVTSKSYRAMRGVLATKQKELPALFAGVRAITTVPGLAAVAVLGILLIGALGTVLLIGGLI
jgi:hypothetical protein